MIQVILCASLLSHWEKRPLVKGEVWFSRELLRWFRVAPDQSWVAGSPRGSRGKPRRARQSGLTGCFSPRARNMSGTDGNEKGELFSDRVRCVWLCLRRLKHQVLFSVFYLFLDDLSRVSFADEDFQQPQLGFNMLVFVVLRCQRGAVLLLHISMGTRKQTVRNWRKVQLWKTHHVNVCTLSYVIFFLPSVLSEKLVLKLFQVLTKSLLVLSSFLELLHKFLPVKDRERERKHLNMSHWNI